MCVRVFWGAFFVNFSIVTGGGFHYRQRCPSYINWVFVEHISIKSTQFEQNWVFLVLSCTKLVHWWVINGDQNRYRESQNFKSGRHIHIQKFSKNLPGNLGPIANSGGRRDWARPGVARRFETTGRRCIANV